MSETKFNSREDVPPYTVVVITGHEQSGKTTIAEAYAASKSPHAMVIDGQSMHRYYISCLYGVAEKQFKFPLNCNVAHINDEDDKFNYAEAYDNSYAAMRTGINWDIFVNYIQSLILRELSKPDGARCFVIDDINYADECERLMEFSNGESCTVFLDGNPSKAKGMDKERFSYMPGEFIKETCGKVPGFHTLLSDRHDGETKEKAIFRCVKQIDIAIRVSRAQREAKKRADAEEKARLAAEAEDEKLKHEKHAAEMK